MILHNGKIGETYLIGGDNEQRNIDLVYKLIKITDTILERSEGFSKNLINFVSDRPGHDFRYALDSRKIRQELKFQPKTSFKTGIKLTFEWYKNNRSFYKSLSKIDILKRHGKND